MFNFGTSPGILILQDYDRYYSYSGDMTVIWVTVGIALLLSVVVIAGVWKVFEKAGQPGWASIVPIYNAIVLLRVAGKPAWWFWLLLIPFVNLYFIFVVMIDLAKNFGKGTGFGVGLALLGAIFFPILGFGDARYQPYRYGGLPQYGGPPQYGAPPPYGAPTPYGQPQYGQPQYGQPQYGQPQYGQPQYGQPQYGQPQYGDQPQYGGPPQQGGPLEDERGK